MTTLRAEQIAVKDIELAFEEAGWSDGNILNSKEVITATNPLYYKDATSEFAADASVVIDGVGRKFYAIYNIVSIDASASANACHHAQVTVAIAFYYDNQYTLAEGSKHYCYVEELLNTLSENEWTISSNGCEAISGQSEHSPFMYRTTIYANNVF